LIGIEEGGESFKKKKKGEEKRRVFGRRKTKRHQGEDTVRAIETLRIGEKRRAKGKKGFS